MIKKMIQEKNKKFRETGIIKKNQTEILKLKNTTNEKKNATEYQ